MLSFIGQVQGVLLDVTVRIGVDEVRFLLRHVWQRTDISLGQQSQNLPLDRSMAWRQRVIRTLGQAVSQERIEAAEARLMEQQGATR